MAGGDVCADARRRPDVHGVNLRLLRFTRRIELVVAVDGKVAEDRSLAEEASVAGRNEAGLFGRRREVSQRSHLIEEDCTAERPFDVARIRAADVAVAAFEMREDVVRSEAGELHEGRNTAAWTLDGASDFGDQLGARQRTDSLLLDDVRCSEQVCAS